MQAGVDIPSESVRTYVRTARRLRHRLRHAPGVLHRSLRTLRPTTPVAVRPDPVAQRPACERFALLVRYSLVGSLLPYSTRQALLRKAARMGIRRFDANLIIAMVQHQAGGSTIDTGCKEPRSRWVLWVALGVQVLIGVGVFSLFL